ncbi:hypothetical protein SSV2p34 [Sulfolobus spindle-shaped virus 2]|uniref:ORF 90 n=1 Tax=Sulfolobus virus-like particle SSV2 TaxID=244590 RepID=Q6UG59_SSV2|nr:hypothetical protein SSV2p34 [Sulfolobus spindle-shaped virus 2]AAQ73281.1 ORF 90 [Sulfolobus spindle-shaped virus 2]
MVLLVPKTYAEIVLVFDTIIMTISLLFRKPKPKSVSLTPNPRFIGWYLVISAITALAVSHFALYQSLIDYFMGLFLNSLIFYVGVKVLVN